MGRSTGGTAGGHGTLVVEVSGWSNVACSRGGAIRISLVKSALAVAGRVGGSLPDVQLNGTLEPDCTQVAPRPLLPPPLAEQPGNASSPTVDAERDEGGDAPPYECLLPDAEGRCEHYRLRVAATEYGLYSASAWYNGSRAAGSPLALWVTPPEAYPWFNSSVLIAERDDWRFQDELHFHLVTKNLQGTNSCLPFVQGTLIPSVDPTGPSPPRLEIHADVVCEQVLDATSPVWTLPVFDHSFTCPPACRLDRISPRRRRVRASFGHQLVLHAARVCVCLCLFVFLQLMCAYACYSCVCARVCAHA